ncbi:MAG: non-canonical purine NTP pyrophosphatase [Candidatus Nanohaloarchaea archaeon]
MKLYFATGNSGKVEHARKLLPKFEVEQLEADTVEPQEATLEEISKYKLRTARDNSGIEEGFIVADDSGIFVGELNGFPGPLSSPFDEKVGKENLLRLVDEDYSARFRASVAVLNVETGDVEVFSGSEEGRLVKPRGKKGFGYDPMFVPEGSDKTWGEDSDQKQQSSHRKEAMEKMANYLSDLK